MDERNSLGGKNADLSSGYIRLTVQLSTWKRFEYLGEGRMRSVV